MYEVLTLAVDAPPKKGKLPRKSDQQMNI